MKGQWKKMFCGVLAAVMLTAAPVAAHADTVMIAGIETEVVQTLPGKATNSTINTKSKNRHFVCWINLYVPWQRI